MIHYRGHAGHTVENVQLNIHRKSLTEPITSLTVTVAGCFGLEDESYRRTRLKPRDP